MYLNHDITKLAKPGRRDLQNTPKVVLQQNSAHPIAFYDSGNYLVLNSATYIANASEELLKTICVLLNSNLISWFFRTVMTNNAGLTVNLLPNNLGLIPVPFEMDLSLFSALCDSLSSYKAATVSNSEDSARFRLWHETLVESLVVSSYFPHLVRDISEYDRLQETIISLASSRYGNEAYDETTVLSAKRILRGFEFIQS
jgi:hypothetical protein